MNEIGGLCSQGPTKIRSKEMKEGSPLQERQTLFFQQQLPRELC
jgi:hypothetical protein